MMAAVFLMQALGQLAAALVGLIVLLSLGHRYNLANLESNNQESIKCVDSIWRIVLGTGIGPALIAIIFRVTIPESPRYTLDVDRDGQRALEDTKDYYGGHHRTSDGSGAYMAGTEMTEYPRAGNGSAMLHRGTRVGTENRERLDSQHSIAQRLGESIERRGEANEEEEEVEDVDVDEDDEEVEVEDDDSDEVPDSGPRSFSSADLYEYFITQGNWHFLAGTTACWFFLDMAYYGLGISNPRRIAQIWLSTSPFYTPLRDWETTDPNESIYNVLRSDGIQYIITVSIGSVVGSFVLIKFIDYVQRKALLTWTFLILAVLFAVVGGSLFVVEYTNMHALTITLYVLCQLAFNLGPNALTFIVSIPPLL